jgi:hypothetical protein
MLWRGWGRDMQHKVTGRIGENILSPSEGFIDWWSVAAFALQIGTQTQDRVVDWTTNKRVLGSYSDLKRSWRLLLGGMDGVFRENGAIQ